MSKGEAGGGLLVGGREGLFPWRIGSWLRGSVSGFPFTSWRRGGLTSRRRRLYYFRKFAFFAFLNYFRYAVLSIACRLFEVFPIFRTATGDLPFPIDALRSGNPKEGSAIYDGYFSFCGQTGIRRPGVSIFRLTSLSAEWQAALLGFSWLSHLRCTKSSIGQACARGLISDWMQEFGYRISRDPGIRAERVLSWLTHAPFILEGADRIFRRKFFVFLALDIRLLSVSLRFLPRDYTRLVCLIALNQSALSLSGYERKRSVFERQLGAEISQQILPDGGHISRNPDVIVQLLLKFLSLRRSFVNCGKVPPLFLSSAIDRMMSMLRFFCHGDGGLASFNGAGELRQGEVTLLLRQDDTQSRPYGAAPHSGYQRIVCSESLLIMDTGDFPPLEASLEAHAGCGSFEFSLGNQRMIVNCGRPAARFQQKWRHVARFTAAHSAVTIGDVSSCIFGKSHGFYSGWSGSKPIVKGAKVSGVRRMERDGQVMLELLHDGYADSFGIMCRRRILLSRDGSELFGEDCFLGETRNAEKYAYAIRFHLHPDVRAASVSERHSVLLTLPNGDIWGMVVRGGEPVVEESVYLPSSSGSRRSQQIVVHGRGQAGDGGVVWVFRRLGSRGGKREACSSDSVE